MIDQAYLYLVGHMKLCQNILSMTCEPLNLCPYSNPNLPMKQFSNFYFCNLKETGD